MDEDRLTSEEGAQTKDSEQAVTFTDDQRHMFEEEERNSPPDAARQRTPGVVEFPEPDVTGLIPETRKKD